jgi:hypothetical protein
MPNLTIYVPKDLAAQLARHDVAVSRTCQNALRRKVRIAERNTPKPTGTYADGVRFHASSPNHRPPTA